jgi:hypothetical protein
VTGGSDVFDGFPGVVGGCPSFPSDAVEGLSGGGGFGGDDSFDFEGGDVVGFVFVFVFGGVAFGFSFGFGHGLRGRVLVKVERCTSLQKSQNWAMFRGLKSLEICRYADINIIVIDFGSS